MERLKCVTTAGILLALAFAARSQTPEPAAPPAPAPAPAPAAGPPEPSSTWSVGPIDFSGLIDGYYDMSFNHPASMTNQLRNFDVQANQFSLNMAKLTLNHDPDPIGFHVDLGFGKAFDMVNSSETGLVRNIEQAFVSAKPKSAKGLEVDFGKFVTSAGAEVIETKDNWNYSRSLLFAWAIPYYHFGLRSTMPIGSHFTAGVQLVNGWNNVVDNNSGKTYGLTGAVNTKKFTWSNNYYTGPETTGTDKGWRQLYDTTLLLTPSDKANFYINWDYGHDRNILASETRWTGIAGAAHFQCNSWFALAPRIEWFNDGVGMSGMVQKLKEFTMTAEFKATEGIFTRLEYRRDWSNKRFFDYGSTPASSMSEPTLLAGFVAYFGPKR